MTPDIATMPFSAVAEVSVCGAILRDPQAMESLADVLRPDHFYQQRLAYVYEAALNLFKHNDGVDLVTVGEELRRQGLYSEGGLDLAFMSDLMAQVQDPKNVSTYARTVMDDAQRRSIINATQQMALLAQRPNISNTELVVEFEKLAQAAIDSRVDSNFYTLDQMVQLWKTRHEDMRLNPQKYMGIPTGIRGIDRILFGLHPMAMYLLAARPGMGKTALAWNIVLNICMHPRRYHVVFFSLEMSKEELMDRAISSASGINNQRFRVPHEMFDFERFNVEQALPRFEHLNLTVNDKPRMTLSEITSKVRRLHRQRPVDLVVIDYLQLITPDKPHANRSVEVGHIAQGLKQFAREQYIPVLPLAQLNRNVESRANHLPVLSDLRETGSLEQESDAVMLIHRPEMYEPHEDNEGRAIVRIVKHRSGPTADVDLMYNKETTTFSDPDEEISFE